MTVCITGATGYLGQLLAVKLSQSGITVHALVRSIQKGEQLLSYDGIRLFCGDILDKDSLRKAMHGCSEVYHLAALVSVWNKNPNAFYTVNVEGLKNVLDCCLELNIKNVLFTSTAGVVGHSEDRQPVTEQGGASRELQTAYELSKVAAEQLLQTYCLKGLRAIIVNPSRVFGPGLLTESNGFTRLLKLYIAGKWHVMPGNGQSIGNYVYIKDAVNGIIMAMKSGRSGERYLLGGINISYNDFFSLVDELTGNKRRMYRFPIPVMILLSRFLVWRAIFDKKQPLIAPAFVRKYTKDWIVSSAKAEKELGYHITPFADALRKTTAWLDEN